jgi:hypothetical protein
VISLSHLTQGGTVTSRDNWFRWRNINGLEQVWAAVLANAVLAYTDRPDADK